MTQRTVRPICLRCGQRRIEAWEKARQENGLTEAEWPKPQSPEFEDTATLRAHTKRVHGVGNG